MTVHSVPANRVNIGSGANNTSRYVGSSTGIALAAVWTLVPGGGGPAHEFDLGMTYAAIVAAALSLLGAGFVALVRDRSVPNSVVQHSSATNAS